MISNDEIDAAFAGADQGEPVTEVVSVDTKGTPIVRVVEAWESPKQIVDLLRSRRDMIADACHPGITPEAIIASLANALMKDPDLARCSPRSTLETVLTAAKLGIDPDGTHNSAWPVRYGSEMKLMPGYGGMVELICRSPDVSHIDAATVFDGDAFDWSKGTSPHIKHVPSSTADRTAKGSHYYAVAFLTNGLTRFEVMDLAEVTKISNNSGPWKQHWNQMAIKTVVRRLAKLMPITREAKQAIEISDQFEGLAPESRDSFEPARMEACRSNRGAEALLESLDQEGVDAG